MTAAISKYQRPTGSHPGEHDVDAVSNSILDIDFATTHGHMAITAAGDRDVDMPLTSAPAPAPSVHLSEILRRCFAPIMNMVKLTLADAPGRYPNLVYAPHPIGLELQFRTNANVITPT